MADVHPVGPAGAKAPKPGTMTQMRQMIIKNIKLQMRNPGLTIAEYVVIPLYFIFWIKVVQFTFPDDRPSLTERMQFEADLNAFVPNACPFVAAGQVAYFPSTSAGATAAMAKVAAGCDAIAADCATCPAAALTSKPADADYSCPWCTWECAPCATATATASGGECASVCLGCVPWLGCAPGAAATPAATGIAQIAAFESQAAFQAAYDAAPANYFAAVGFDADLSAAALADRSKALTFTLYYNQTLAEGRVIPHVDPVTGALVDAKEPLVFAPAMSRRGYVMGFGDNRLADLQSRVTTALRNSDSPVALTVTSFPTLKPECDGVGCVMMWMWPSLIGSIYFISIQNLLTNVGKEKERGIKEALMLAGCDQKAYWGSWYIAKMLDSVMVALVFTAGMFITQVWEHQQFGWNLLVLLLYAAALFPFCFWAQAFFKTQMSMFLGSLVLLMLSQFLYYPVRILMIDKFYSVGAITATFVFPTLPISHIFFEMAEADGLGMSADFSEPMLLNSVIMLPVNAVAWMIIAWYFENIMPQAHGPAFQSPTFCCSGGYWRRKERANLARDLKQGVVVKGLVKEYPILEAADDAAKTKKKDGKKEEKKKIMRAVDGLSCTFEAGTITAVLGHNGAGKTTTIRCITGSQEPTSGSVSINGVDGLANTQWLRENVGVCPQHDVLYDDLTAGEHVELFGALKGDSDVETALKGVDLLSKKDELVKTFSGGQKRRLSVALALLGEPAVIVLDEPTTGMDVIARQFVWNMIQEKKGTSTIILTTHAMEEADALGDRIVVISKGKVQAAGTALDLKVEFGIGYHLHVIKDAAACADNSFDAGAVHETLKSFNLEGNEVSLLTDVGAECSFGVPRDTAAFPKLFTALRERKKELKIEQVALSMTTLEEVFLRLGQKEEEEERKKEREENGGDDDDDGAAAEGATETKGADTTVKVSMAGAGEAGFWQQIWGLFYLIWSRSKRDQFNQTFVIYNPIFIVLVCGGIYLAVGKGELTTEAVYPLIPNFAPKAFPYVIEADAANRAANAVSKMAELGKFTAVQHASEAALLTALKDGEGSLAYTFGIVLNAVSGTSMAVKLLFNDTVAEQFERETNDSPPVASVRDILAVVSNADPLTVGTGADSVITPSYTQLAKGPTAYVNAAENAGGRIMLGVAMVFAYLSALFGETMVRNRVKGHRVHLLVSSLGRVQYYLSNYLVHFALMLVPLIMTPFLLWAFQFESILRNNILSYLILVLVFATPAIGFGYVLSWGFHSIEAAQEWIQEIIGIVMIVPFFITAFVSEPSQFGQCMLMLIPGYAVYRGFSVLEAEAWEGKPYDTVGSIFDTDRDFVYVLLMLLVDTVLYWVLVMAAEYAEPKVLHCMASMRQSKGTAEVEKLPREPDSQVKDEAQKVTAGNASAALQILNLNKKFVRNNGSINHAVKDMCLGVEKGTIFGMLGMNGAGKTTLLHCIQGKHVPTDGDATVLGVSVTTQIDKARKLFGICPQHDILFENVTPREHLYAFAHIRGVPKDEIPAMVTHLLHRLGLSKKAGEKSQTLSGGQKRKLSIAMSVIGNPMVIFLDEPTTGVDPNTRRFIWDYILEVAKGRVVVLTTHSMEEADALCTRIGIMVNGRLMTLGSPQQLKQAYGTGYRVTVRMEETVTSAQTEGLGGCFSLAYDAKVKFANLSSSLTTRVFDIETNDLDLGQLFTLLEGKRAELSIKDYSVTQTTMDQVFTRFAQFQHQEA